jgi:transcriptional regulator with XRE-family HTH domain/3-hydroxymyristoyl/3-hydroxydecanoyl-(acyl carrier protein) dehydratase
LEALWSSGAKVPLRRRVVTAAPAESMRFFDKTRLNALAEGRPSDALGRAYARFDDGDFVARLPREPYNFIDQAEVRNCPPYEIQLGAEVSALYTVRRDNKMLADAGGADPALPYAALNEIALQPCGFLAAYMGSALPFEGAMHFRNLGGQATVHAHLRAGDKVSTVARLVRSSRMGDMLIQYYDFTCSKAGRVVYEGQTHFGFFSPAALANQGGIAGEAAVAPPESLSWLPYPTGDLWPRGRCLRMIDKIALDPDGGRAALGAAYTCTKVDPEAWFFRAHFYQDPVWPGSLGLEAFIQAAQALLVAKYGSENGSGVWAAPMAGSKHEWLYRGQITPDKREMSIALTVTEASPAARSISCEGLLMVDGLPIYKLSGFTVGLTEAAAPRATRRRGSGGEPAISPDQLLNWRKEQGLSQGQLAKLMGVTPIYISLMERGKRNISPLMIEKLGLIFSGGLTEAAEVSDQESEILSKGTLKSRREKKAAAAKLLSSEQLREMRLARGLSQKRLADQVGVTATLIGLIELGKRGLSLELAQKLLAALENEAVEGDFNGA